MENPQTMYDTILFGIRRQGGPEYACCGGPDKDGRYCAVGIVPNMRGWGRSGAIGEVTGACIDAHNDSAHAAGNSDAEFFRLWEPRMKAIADELHLTYTPPADDGFAAFRAKILAPLAVTA